MATKPESDNPLSGWFIPIIAGIVAFFMAASWKSGRLDELAVGALLLLGGCGALFYLFVLPRLRGEGKSDVPSTDSPWAVAKPTPKWEDRLPGHKAASPAAAPAQPAPSKAAAPAAAPAPVAAPAPMASAAAEVGTRPAALDGARGGHPDDLKQIKGVGPRLEKMLHGLGFYHFDQIASWTPDEVAWVDEHIEGFKGRVTRDNWVSQASTLAAGGTTEFSARVSQGEVYD